MLLYYDYCGKRCLDKEAHYVVEVYENCWFIFCKDKHIGLDKIALGTAPDKFKSKRLSENYIRENLL